jgi:hypothetical protein
LGRAKHDHLVDGGALGGDDTRLLERVHEEVAMSALSWILEQHARATLLCLMVSLPH